jgi:hypothetical protein
MDAYLDEESRRIESVDLTTVEFDSPPLPPLHTLDAGPAISSRGGLVTRFYADRDGGRQIIETNVTVDPRVPNLPVPPWRIDRPSVFLVVPALWSMHIRTTSGPTWSYNPSLFPLHGPEGIDSRGNPAYPIPEANEGALIGISPFYPSIGTRVRFWYEPRYDASSGQFSGFWRNEYDIQIELWLSINDGYLGLADNYGFMNVAFSVFRGYPRD